MLSKSTKDYDQGETFEHYRTLDSLREYLLVAQDRPHIEHNVRQSDNKWLLSETGDIKDAVELASIGCRLLLSEVYDQINDIEVS